METCSLPSAWDDFSSQEWQIYKPRLVSMPELFAQHRNDHGSFTGSNVAFDVKGLLPSAEVVHLSGVVRPKCQFSLKDHLVIISNIRSYGTTTAGV